MNMDKDTRKTALLDVIKRRRSTRVFLKDPVLEETVKEIVEAGRYAPSGGNGQTTHFYVFTSAEKMAELRDAVTAALVNMPIEEGTHPVFVNLIQRAKKGEADVTYGAAALIVTAGPKGSPITTPDTTCALQNMMLAATANEVGNVWVNQFIDLQYEPPVKAFFEALGKTEDEELCGALALGYTNKLETEPLPRTGFPVTYV